MGALIVTASTMVLTMSARHAIPSNVGTLLGFASMVLLAPVSILYFAVGDPHWELFVIPVLTCAMVAAAAAFTSRFWAAAALTLACALWVLSQWIIVRSAL